MSGQYKIIQDASQKRNACPLNFSPFSRSLRLGDENSMNDTMRCVRNTRTMRSCRNSKGKIASALAASTSERLSNAQRPQVRIAVIAAIYLAYGTVDPHRIPRVSN